MRFSAIAERLCDACLAEFGEDPVPEEVCPRCRERLLKLLDEWRRELLEHLEEKQR